VYDAYVSTLEEKLSEACEASLDAALTGQLREDALKQLVATRKADAAKHVRVIKNTQYAFVQRDLDRVTTAEEDAAWKQMSDTLALQHAQVMNAC
jgi:hypothetical protein